MTGVPSLERRTAVELVLERKSLDYYVYSCTSHTTLREVLSDFCKYISVVDANKSDQ